jgi:hypothetical protein
MIDTNEEVMTNVGYVANPWTVSIYFSDIITVPGEIIQFHGDQRAQFVPAVGTATFTGMSIEGVESCTFTLSVSNPVDSSVLDIKTYVIQFLPEGSDEPAEPTTTTTTTTTTKPTTTTTTKPTTTTTTEPTTTTTIKPTTITTTKPTTTTTTKPTTTTKTEPTTTTTTKPTTTTTTETTTTTPTITTTKITTQTATTTTTKTTTTTTTSPPTTTTTTKITTPTATTTTTTTSPPKVIECSEREGAQFDKKESWSATCDNVCQSECGAIVGETAPICNQVTTCEGGGSTFAKCGETGCECDMDSIPDSKHITPEDYITVKGRHK